MAVGDRAFGRNAKAIEPSQRADSTNTARSLATIVASFLGLSRSNNDNVRRHREPGPALELDCVRDVLAPAIVRAAEQRSRETATGADQVLIKWGVVGEEEYLRRSAAALSS